MVEKIPTSIRVHTSKPLRVKVPPLRVPRPWKPASATALQEAVHYQPLEISDAELRLARKRNAIFEQYDDDMIDASQAMELLELKKSQFYTLYNQYLGSDSYLELARKKRGTKPGKQTLTEGQRSALEMAFQSKYIGPSASSAKVWKESQRLCPDNEKPPSKYQAKKFVAEKPKKERDYRKLGKKRGDEKYISKPNKKPMERVLQQVQMDHTMMDILLVDEFDRAVIVGRPWLTLIMCSLTRVILGFYLSLQAPSLRTVANVLTFAVLDKFSHLGSYLGNPDIYPYRGIPFQIYTDNGPDFTSPRFIAKCKRWGMDWDHRPIGKTWYGGLIERVIGTFMSEVHFLPGTTGSNVLQREGLTPELDAKYDIVQCAKYFLNQAIIYHGTVHENLGCTPRQAWDYYDSQGLLDRDRIILPEQQNSFQIDFMPPSYNHVIHPYGINFAGRRYSSYELDPYIGLTDIEIRYLPYDLGSIWVLVPGKFLNIPCLHTRDRLSNNWESYNNHKKLSSARQVGHNAPSGLIDDPYAFDAQRRQYNLALEVQAKSPNKSLPIKDVTPDVQSLRDSPKAPAAIGTPRVIVSGRSPSSIIEPKIIVDRFKL